MNRKKINKYPECPDYGSNIQRLIDTNKDEDLTYCYEIYLTMIKCHIDKECSNPLCKDSIDRAFEIIETNYHKVVVQ